MSICQRPQPWNPADATDSIRAIAKGNYKLHQKRHSSERLKERGLFISDLLYVLKNGFVYEDAAPSTREGFYKYCIECSTPNTNQRSLKVVVIPCINPAQLKIITIMWVDE